MLRSHSLSKDKLDTDLPKQVVHVLVQLLVVLLHVDEELK